MREEKVADDDIDITREQEILREFFGGESIWGEKRRKFFDEDSSETLDFFV